MKMRNLGTELTVSSVGLGCCMGVSFAYGGHPEAVSTIPSSDTLSADDWRRTLPRFQSDAMAANARLVNALTAIAAAKGRRRRSWRPPGDRDEFLVPIPGARRLAHLEDNVAAAEIVLDAADRAAIETASPQKAVARSAI